MKYSYKKLDRRYDHSLFGGRNSRNMSNLKNDEYQWLIIFADHCETPVYFRGCKEYKSILRFYKNLKYRKTWVRAYLNYWNNLLNPR